jgi:hypothetical protein
MSWRLNILLDPSKPGKQRQDVLLKVAEKCTFSCGKYMKINKFGKGYLYIRKSAVKKAGLGSGSKIDGVLRRRSDDITSLNMQVSYESKSDMTQRAFSMRN